MGTRTNKVRSGRKNKADRDPKDAATTRRTLRTLDEAFVEETFDAKVGGAQYAGAVLLSLGGLAFGAGTYALAFISAGKWHDNGAAMLLGGLVLEAGFLTLGSAPHRPLRVGSLGVGLEEDGKLRRWAWWELKRLRIEDAELVVETGGEPILVSLERHAAAAGRIIAEARKRIPGRVDVASGAVVSGPTSGSKGPAEPPQVAGATCRATGVALTFERDVRMCASCGALYHRTGVPGRCAECDTKLK